MVDRRNAYLTLAAGLAMLYGFAAWLTFAGPLPRAPGKLGAAATFDLTVTAALATWLLGSRRGRLHRRAPFVVLGLGFVAARLILPANAREGLVVLRGAWALVELALLALVIAQVRTLRARYRAQRVGGAPASLALENALAPFVGALPARLFATEVGVLAFALAGWRRRTPVEDARTFSMHRRAHHGLMVGVLVFLILAESLVLHLVVARLSIAAAWILTGSSLWAALWLIGDAQAARLQPLELRPDGLRVVVGIRWHTFVPYDAIAGIRPDDAASRSKTTLAATVGRAADVRIVLRRPLEARGLLGLTRRYDTLLLTVDRPAELIAALRQ